MANADPPHKIDDCESPGDWDIDAPDSHPSDEQVTHRHQEQHHQGEGEQKPDPPAQRSLSTENYRANLFRHRRKGVSGANDGKIRVCRWFKVLLHLITPYLIQCWDCAPRLSRLCGGGYSVRPANHSCA